MALENEMSELQSSFNELCKAHEELKETTNIYRKDIISLQTKLNKLLQENYSKDVHYKTVIFFSLKKKK